jgi:hypothetical protein
VSCGGATDDLFIIKNLPLYLGDSARTWLKCLSRGNIQYEEGRVVSNAWNIEHLHSFYP